MGTLTSCGSTASDTVIFYNNIQLVQNNGFRPCCQMLTFPTRFIAILQVFSRSSASTAASISHIFVSNWWVIVVGAWNVTFFNYISTCAFVITIFTPSARNSNEINICGHFHGKHEEIQFLSGLGA